MKEINEDADDEIISGRNKFIKKSFFHYLIMKRFKSKKK